MNHWWLWPVLMVASWAMTDRLRRYALAQGVMDVPGARSSHVMPTPRGGGLAFVLAFLGGVMALRGFGQLDGRPAAALLGGGALVAAVGFADDHWSVAPHWRLLVHFLAAGWALVWLGGVPQLVWFGGAPLDLHSLGWLLGSLYLVWMTNLYNFMDGIDGIAGLEAICASLGAALLCVLANHLALAAASLLLTAAVAGFLYWNFPPAKIFMGDVGSGFLGLTLGVLSLQNGGVEPRLFWGWTILLGVFVVDATFTLACRAARGARLHEAHRCHAYQRAARRYGSHRPITLAVGAINVFWLLPIAISVVVGAVEGAVGLLIAYVPLVLLAVKFQAGQLEAPA